MKRRIAVFFIARSAALSFCGFAVAARKPNIVLIIADDLGYRELGCFGQKKIRTPNLDALAQHGMRLTQHYSGNAVCAPSRCVLMTGRHPGHAYIRSNKGTPPEGQWPIPDEEVTIAELLQKQGYVTGAFGKWGLGGPESAGRPCNQGVDRFFGYTPHFTPRAAYAAMITRMDRYIGNVLRQLDELNLADNTIVVFSSDNGTTHLGEEVDYEFINSVGELRGLKGSLYEGGVRVPTIVRWPSHVPAGEAHNYVSGFEDWMPTLLDLIGAKKDIPANIDGISIAMPLLGEK